MNIGGEFVFEFILFVELMWLWEQIMDYKDEKHFSRGDNIYECKLFNTLISNSDFQIYIIGLVSSGAKIKE